MPTLRLRELDFEPDLVRRELYDLEIENVTDPALNTLFHAKRDEIARQITALEDRDTARFLYGSLQLYGGMTPPLVSAAKELLEIIPHSPEREQRDCRGVRRRGSCGDRSLPRRLSGLPLAHRRPRRRLRADGVFRSADHPRDGSHSGGPRPALAAPRGRHPRRDLPERRQATTEAADDRTARLRRDPGRSRRARGVPDRRAGPAASPRARRAGSSRSPSCWMAPAFLEIFELFGPSTGFRRGPRGRSRSASSAGAAR